MNTSIVLILFCSSLFFILLEHFFLWNKKIPCLEKLQLVVFRAKRSGIGNPDNLFDIIDKSLKQYNSIPSVYTPGALFTRRLLYQIAPKSGIVFLRSRIYEWPWGAQPETFGYLGRITFEQKQGEIIFNITASMYFSFIFYIPIALLFFTSIGLSFWIGIFLIFLFMSSYVFFMRNAFNQQILELASVIQKNMQKSLDTGNKCQDFK